MALAVVTTYLLHKYTNFRTTPPYVLVITWIGWYLCFSVVFLVPIDVSSSFHDQCIEKDGGSEDVCPEPLIYVDRAPLEVMWKVVYWTTYILCWAVYPVLQSYVLAGDFTVFERFRSALKENIIFYSIAGAVLAVLFVILLINNHFDWLGILGMGMAAANAWGLILLILLLGYGLVEIPKKLWHSSNRTVLLKWYCYQATIQKEQLDKDKKEMDVTLRLVKKYSEKIKENDPFREYIEIIIGKCPLEYKDIHAGEGDAEMTYKALVNLHCRVMKAEHRLRRSSVLYEILMQSAFELQDIQETRKTGAKKLIKTFATPRVGRYANEIDTLEYYWKCFLQTKALRVLTFLTILISLVIIWSETVFSSTDPDLSIFSLAINVKDLSFTLVFLYCFLPTLFIVVCSYWTTFKIRIFNYYRLVPHHQSDGNSIMFSAALLTRLAAPVAYNFLLMIHMKECAFCNVLGLVEEKVTPLLGEKYNIYFPILLIVFCALTAFDAYTRFVHAFCGAKWHTFVYDEDFKDKKIEQGADIIDKERLHRERLAGIVRPGTQKEDWKARFFAKIYKNKPRDTENLLNRAEKGQATSPSSATATTTASPAAPPPKTWMSSFSRNNAVTPGASPASSSSPSSSSFTPVPLESTPSASSFRSPAPTFQTKPFGSSAFGSSRPSSSVNNGYTESRLL